MKKTLILVLVLAFIPLLSFAELGLGASAFFNSPVLIGEPIDKSELRESGFTFGGDVRFKLSILQLEALGLVTLGDQKSIDLYADAGVAVTWRSCVCPSGLVLRFSSYWTMPRIRTWLVSTPRPTRTSSWDGFPSA